MTHVLIVDDEIDNQQLLQEILGDYGISSMVAAGIDEAVGLATEHSFDIVLMDMTIPQRQFGRLVMLGGVEATREIIARLGDKSPSFIAVTAQGMPDINPKIYEAGICRIVEKSIDLEYRIVEALGSVLGKPLAKPQLPGTHRSALPAVALAGASADGQAAGRDGAVQRNDSPPSPSPLEKPSSVERSSSEKEPSSVWELRNQVQSRLKRATLLLDPLMNEAGDTDRDPDYVELLRTLRSKLDQVIARLASADDGPQPGEEYGHWIVNLLIGPARAACKLLEAEQRDHFGKFAGVLETVKQEVHGAIALGKSKIGHRRVELKPESTAKPVDEMKTIPPKEPPKPSNWDAYTGPSTLDDPASDVMEPIPKPAIDPTQRLVLIVDDETESRRDLEEKLKRLRYRVVSCDSSSTALVFLESQRFDVCLIDLNMPEITGLQLIERIRQSPMSANASIIVVSGCSESSAAAEAIEKGADDYLEKPADERLLKARIQSCLRQTDARLSELCKFLPLNVVQRVLSNRDLLEKPSPADITVMVCDIRGFSRISERVGPVRTIEWIRDVMNRLSRIILHRGGTIIDYVGDEIMAMWGAPIATQSHADDACNCALAVQQAAEELSVKWFPVLDAKLRIGIGINSGLAVVGNTGSKHRTKYGPLGNTVNMASRVQGATKYLQSSVLITEDTASRIASHLKGRRICAVRVQNINEPVRLFELAAAASDHTHFRYTMYERALKAFEEEKLSEALIVIAKLLTEAPDDGPSKLLMMRVIQAQLGGSFDPVWTLPGK